MRIFFKTLQHFWHVHLESAVLTLKNFLKTPLSASLSILVFGLVISLPIALYWATLNMKVWLQPFKNGGELTVFLKKDISAFQVEVFQEKIKHIPLIKKTTLLPPNTVLEEFQSFSNMQDVVSALGENPFPNVLLITPKDWDATTVQQLEALLKADPVVDSFEWDRVWVLRLQAILKLLEQSTLILAIFLGAGFIMVMSHSMRVHVQTHAQEIAIAKWVGATDAFVRRPFLYIGFWLGLLGSLTGLCFVSFGFWLIQANLLAFAETYGGQWEWIPLSWAAQMYILALCASLGVVSAYLGTSYYLYQLRPKG